MKRLCGIWYGDWKKYEKYSIRYTSLGWQVRTGRDIWAQMFDNQDQAQYAAKQEIRIQEQAAKKAADPLG
jgi:hypothetical protein